MTMSKVRTTLTIDESVMKAVGGTRFDQLETVESMASS